MLLWACVSPCVGESAYELNTRHFLSLCVNRNEILEDWPFSRTFYSFYSLVSDTVWTAVFQSLVFSSFLMAPNFPGQRFLRESVPAGIGARSAQFFLTIWHMSQAGPTLYPMQSGFVLVVCEYVDPSVERGRILLLIVFSLCLSWFWCGLTVLSSCFSIFTAIWRTIRIQNNSWNHRGIFVQMNLQMSFLCVHLSMRCNLQSPIISAWVSMASGFSPLLHCCN